MGNSKTTRIDIIAENIIRFTVKSGAGTATVSAVLLALGVTALAARPRYYQALATTLVKLYVTALMVLLNGRKKLGSAAHPATWTESEIDHDVGNARRGTVSTGVHNTSAETRSGGARRLRDSDATAVERASPPGAERAGEGEKGAGAPRAGVAWWRVYYRSSHGDPHLEPVEPFMPPSSYYHPSPPPLHYDAHRAPYVPPRPRRDSSAARPRRNSYVPPPPPFPICRTHRRRPSTHSAARRTRACGTTL